MFVPIPHCFESPHMFCLLRSTRCERQQKSRRSKRIVLNKINTWFNRLNSEKELQEQQINTWIEYIHDNQDTDIKMPYLENATPDIARLKNNLVITSSYYNILNKLNTITNQDSSNKSKEDILRYL